MGILLAKSDEVTILENVELKAASRFVIPCLTGDPDAL